jgi:outer membrane protein assembly factor BamB
VFPHNASNSSPAGLGELLFVGTSNGQNEEHSQVPSPQAPSLIAVEKKTGKLVWSDNSPGRNILNGQWTSPAVADIEGVNQVIIGQGDGWVRSFEATSGKKLWEFNTNPKDSVYPATRNEILATPVVSGKYVYIANGQDPESGEGVGHLYCIDATKRGDITESGRVWHYSKIRRSISSAVVHEGLVYYPDFSGFLHCLDAATGEPYWVHDTFAAVWSSPVVIGGKVYLGDEDGDIVVLAAGKNEKVLTEINMGASIYSSPVPANGVLYVTTRNQLIAVAADSGAGLKTESSR